MAAMGGKPEDADFEPLRFSKEAKCCGCCSICCLFTLALMPVTYTVFISLAENKLRDDAQVSVCSMKLCAGQGNAELMLDNDQCKPCLGKLDQSCGTTISNEITAEAEKYFKTGTANTQGAPRKNEYIMSAEMWASMYNPTMYNVHINGVALSMSSNFERGQNKGANINNNPTMHVQILQAMAGCKSVADVQAKPYDWVDIRLYCAFSIPQFATLYGEWRDSCSNGHCKFNSSMTNVTYSVDMDIAYGWYRTVLNGTVPLTDAVEELVEASTYPGGACVNSPAASDALQLGSACEAPPGKGPLDYKTAMKAPEIAGVPVCADMVMGGSLDAVTQMACCFFKQALDWGTAPTMGIMGVMNEIINADKVAYVEI